MKGSILIGTLDIVEQVEIVEEIDVEQYKDKPRVKIGDFTVIVDVTKPEDKYIITKKYGKTKLFHKANSYACTSRLYKGTHFDSKEKAVEHFNTFIVPNWKNTKAFKIEPVSNFFISDWMITDVNGYNAHSMDIAYNDTLVLKNKNISIDDFKNGKQVTTAQKLLEYIAHRSVERTKRDIESIRQWEASMFETKRAVENRTNKMQSLYSSVQELQNTIDKHTSDAENTVKLFYGKE